MTYEIMFYGGMAGATITLLIAIIIFIKLKIWLVIMDLLGSGFMKKRIPFSAARPVDTKRTDKRTSSEIKLKKKITESSIAAAAEMPQPPGTPPWKTELLPPEAGRRLLLEEEMEVTALLSGDSDETALHAEVNEETELLAENETELLEEATEETELLAENETELLEEAAEETVLLAEEETVLLTATDDETTLLDEEEEALVGNYFKKEAEVIVIHSKTTI